MFPTTVTAIFAHRAILAGYCLPPHVVPVREAWWAVRTSVRLTLGGSERQVIHRLYNIIDLLHARRIVCLVATRVTNYGKVITWM
jgi:hypothetical protein